MSYALYVGKNHSADGHAYLAGYGDEPSSHWLEVVPRLRHAPEATIEVGVTAAADLPGERIEIAQVEETLRHIRVSYSYYMGVPAPLTNGGLNECGVAIRDVWSPSRAELVALTPTNQRGLNYSDLARVALERATSARHAVTLIGDLIAEHGEATYGGNSHLFADPEEAWVVIQFAGGSGLWAAER
ncbi:MAG: C69 family dipeptidase, partial [Pseudomonadota bacterium]